MFGRLPDCDKVFLTYFDRWYDADDRSRKTLRATRPDVVTAESLVGRSPAEASPLTEEGVGKVSSMVASMFDAARGDWPTYLDLTEPVDVTWVDAFDRFHDRERVRAILKVSMPEDFASDLIVSCCEFGAVIGHVLIESSTNLHWIYD